MEGPLVSDTTELLSGAAPASEDPPTGRRPAASPRSSGRSGGDLSKLLVSDLQRLAQELGISGTGRMRKGDLVAAITERTGGVRSTPKQSATRAASAGADTARPLNQDAMEADTSARSATAAAPAAGGDAPAIARPSGAGETDRPAVSDRAATSDRAGLSAAAQPPGLAADQPADAGAESQSQGGGQDGRRDRRRNGRRDEQGGNGRDQRRDNRGEGGRDSREGREPAA